MRSNTPGKKEFYVYQLRLKGSRKPFYIGRGRGNRMYHHFQANALRTHSHKTHTILKAQADGIEVLAEVLHDTMTEKQACRKEAELIAQFGRRDIGTGCLTNQTDGGDGGQSGYRFSEEQRARMSEVQKALGRKLTPEHIAALRRPRSEEFKAKLRAANLGKKMSVESRAKMSEAGKRKKPTVLDAAAREKIAASRRGVVMAQATRDKLRDHWLTPLSDFKAKIKATNPLLIVVDYYVRPQVSVFRCRGCKGEMELFHVNATKGKVPRGHFGCIPPSLKPFYPQKR